MTGLSRALRILDEVQTLAALDAVDPTTFLGAMTDVAPVADGLLGEIDRFAQKGMRIRLNHLSDALPQRLCLLFSSTIVAYDGDVALLRGRVAGMLRRIYPDRSTAAALTSEICEAAARVLRTRATLRQAVLGGAQRTARIPAPEPAVRLAPIAAPTRARQEPAEPEMDPTSKRFSLLELD